VRDLSEYHLELRRWVVMSLLATKLGVGGEGTATLNKSIVRWLETCQHHDVAPPPELVDAIARQLKVVRSNRDPGQDMADIAIALALDPSLTNKRLASARGVSLPTIARWKAQPGFERIRAEFETIFAKMTDDEKQRALRETDVPWLQKLFRSAKRRNP
jgi:hypothetical protein